MINDSLFLQIKNLSHMTKGESNIVGYFKKVRTELAMENINSISNGAKVSKATVTRFIKKLGYKDFAQFKVSLRSELFSKLESPYQRYQVQKNTQSEESLDPWVNTVEATIGDLKKAMSLNNNEKMTQVAKILLQKQGRLFIMGQLSSYGIAHYFWQGLNHLKPAILLDNQGGILYRQLVDINKNDVLFAISYTGYVKQTALTMKHFYDNGAQVILLTDSETSPPTKWSHIQLLAPTQWETLIMSRCSCLMVVEGLLSTMTRTTTDSQNKKHTEEVRHLIDQFDVFMVKQDTPLQLQKEINLKTHKLKVKESK